MNRWGHTKRTIILSSAVALWLSAPLVVWADNATVTTDVVHVKGTWAEEEAKLNSQQVQIITKKEIEKKQAKSVEDIIFTQTGVSRTVDAMGRVGVSIRGAEARHTLILVDGQPVLGDFDKYSGAADEVQRLGTENVERIEVIQGAASAKYGSDAVGGVVNIITKKAQKKPSVQFNAEGMRRKSDGDVFPFQNFFIRADSGQMGKLKVGLSGSKRDLMPVLASVKRRASGMAFDYAKHNFKPNVLRYYGDAADIGLVATYEANDKNKVELRLNRYTEDLVRDVKHSDSDLEPQQHFKRTADRNTANLQWSSRAGKSDWTVETNYSRIKENDVALINYTGRSAYEGSNELRYIDNIDHRQLDIRVNANTQVNKNHLLSYGVSYAREEGSGSRLKSSPNTSTMYIDPWDYDKSLLVDRLDRLVRRKGDNSIKVYSHIHDYKFINSGGGMPQWDMDYEYYGAANDAQKPGITYDDYVNYGLSESRLSEWSSTSPNNQPVTDEFKKRYYALENRLKSENPEMAAHRANIVGDYFKYGESNDPEMRKKAPKIDTVIHEDPKRWDLRGLQMVTIDGEDAKDLDDAVSGRKLPNGNYELGVHIADVSHYVTSGQPIDNEAYKRGTSVYLVDRVVPMLPEVLSNGICSLNAHEDRYAMTCMMEIDDSGTVVNYRIRPSIIHVGRRCSYKEVYKALEENIIPDDLVDFIPMLRDLAEISKILNRMRRRRGALDFDFPEYKVLLDLDGTPLRIVKRDRTMAERLIEECMLIANETVATHLRDTERTSVYRIHENPSEEKLDLFQKVLNYLGQNLVISADGVTPRDFQKILDVVKGQDIEQVAQIMTLRSMQQAKYSIENVGHFGLASTCYTHFTSPIRRYPDLMVHRLLKADMHWKGGYSKRDVDEAFLAGAVEHSSIQEQVATEAERETTDLKKTQYMVPFVGEVFEGTIASITSFGMFVELENGIDGLVHISMMNDDYYFFDEEHFVLVGKRTGKTYHLGEKVTVTLVKADVEKKQIDFVLGEVDNLMAIQEQLNSGSDYANSRDGFGNLKGRKLSRKNGRKTSKRDDSKAGRSRYDAFSKKSKKGKSSHKKSNKATKRGQSKKSKSKRKR